MKSFTFIETLIVVVVFAIIIVLVFGLIAHLYKTHGYTWQQSVAIDEARQGIKTMVKEIREARMGDDGSYPIEKAGDKEFVFYSDIDRDGATERVRYFLGTEDSGSQIQECFTLSDGGSCSVSFTDFLEGDLQSAQLKVSVEGDFAQFQEYAEIYADGQYLGRVCQRGCSDCAGVWQGTTTFDVTDQAADGFIQFTVDASSLVNDLWHCDWQQQDHAMKVRFEFSWEQELPGMEHQFKKGVINPTASPVEYPQDQEEISVLSSYVRNVPPIFEYFDKDGNKIEEYPARLADTKMMKVYLVVNVNPERAPSDFELESYVQIRNLKEE